MEGWLICIQKIYAEPVKMPQAVKSNVADIIRPINATRLDMILDTILLDMILSLVIIHKKSRCYHK